MTQKVTILDCSEWRDICLNNVSRLHGALTGLSKPTEADVSLIGSHLEMLQSRVRAWARAPIPGAEPVHIAAPGAPGANAVYGANAAYHTNSGNGTVDHTTEPAKRARGWPKGKPRKPKVPQAQPN